MSTRPHVADVAEPLRLSLQQSGTLAAWRCCFRCWGGGGTRWRVGDRRSGSRLRHRSPFRFPTGRWRRGDRRRRGGSAFALGQRLEHWRRVRPGSAQTSRRGRHSKPGRGLAWSAAQTWGSFIGRATRWVPDDTFALVPARARKDTFVNQWSTFQLTPHRLVSDARGGLARLLRRPTTPRGLRPRPVWPAKGVLHRLRRGEEERCGLISLRSASRRCTSSPASECYRRLGWCDRRRPACWQSQVSPTWRAWLRSFWSASHSCPPGLR